MGLFEDSLPMRKGWICHEAGTPPDPSENRR
jgi:hypothetical protein